MDKDNLHKKVFDDEDFVKCPKCGNSLNKYLSKHQDTIPPNVAARLLMMSEEEVETLYQEAVQMMQDRMKKDE